MSPGSTLDNETLALLIQLAPDAMIVIDEKGVIQFANIQIENIFGYKPEEIIGQYIEILMPQRIRDVHQHHRNHYYSAPKTRAMGSNLDLVGLRKSGEEFPVEISLSPLKIHDKTYATAAIRDVTEKKRKEKKLIAANSNLERFAYIASHDLQEPLRTLQQLINMLEETTKDLIDDNLQNLMKRIVTASNRMSTLIADLLGYAGLGKKRELKEVDCQALIEEIEESLAAKIKNSKAEIIIKTPLPVINAYQVELSLLFQNLIDNGIKFHKKDVLPVITIECVEMDQHWKFTVADNGIGIEEKYFKKLFNVFQRLHTREEYSGNGIGLAHCKKIMDIHGGEIWIESEPGQGTTFHFMIPKNIQDEI